MCGSEPDQLAPDRSHPARMRFRSHNDHGMIIQAAEFLHGLADLRLRVRGRPVQDANGVRRNPLRHQNFLVVKIFAQVSNIHGLQIVCGGNRRRNPDLVGVTGLVDAGGFDGAFRKAPAQYEDDIRMREWILDDQPTANGEK